MFNILTDRVPKSVEIDGKNYEINWEFHYHVKIIILLQDPELDDATKTALALNIFYPEIPANIEEADRQMKLFYVNDKPKNHAQKSAEAEAESTPALYSYEIDDEYIFSAFVEKYGINLQTVTGLHWYEFRALLRSLQDCWFADIMRYRGTKTNEIKNLEMRRQYERLKAYWSLPTPQAEQDVVDELEAILMGDGDLTEFERRLTQHG